MRIDFRKESDWLEKTVANLAKNKSGYAIIENVLDQDFVKETRDSMYDVREKMYKEVEPDRIKRFSGDNGILRLMMVYNSHFFKFFELPFLLKLVDKTLGESAVLQTQNGLIHPPLRGSAQPESFQYMFHMDFPRVMNGYLTSVNMMFMIDDYNEENGGTLIVPGSHQMEDPPNPKELADKAINVVAPSGSMFVYDSTLYHAGGQNLSGKDRLGINHIFCRSYFKQQLDFCRSIPEETMERLPERTKQMMGYYTRVPVTLDQYYQPNETRWYKKGQG